MEWGDLPYDERERFMQSLRVTPLPESHWMLLDEAHSLHTLEQFEAAMWSARITTTQQMLTNAHELLRAPWNNPEGVEAARQTLTTAQSHLDRYLLEELLDYPDALDMIRQVLLPPELPDL